MFVEEFIHNYDKDSDKGYILEVDAKYLKKLHRLHSNFLFLLDKLKIENCDKLKYNLQWQQSFPRTKKDHEWSNEPWIEAKESTHVNQTQSEMLAKNIYRYEHETENKN